jgi:hypothetical protein
MPRFIIGFDLQFERDYPTLWLIELISDRLELRNCVCLPPRTDFFFQLRVLDDMIAGLPPDSYAILLTDESGYSAYAARDAQYRHPELRVEHVTTSRAQTWNDRRAPPRLRTRAERLAIMREALEYGVVRMAPHFEWTIYDRNGLAIGLN